MEKGQLSLSKITEYKMVASANEITSGISFLTEHIDMMIAEGYQPYGPLISSENGRLIQPMVKYIDESGDKPHREMQEERAIKVV